MDPTFFKFSIFNLKFNMKAKLDKPQMKQRTQRKDTEQRFYKDGQDWQDLKAKDGRNFRAEERKC